MKLKVMSFNICHGQGIDGRQDLRRAADVIRESGAALVGVQEVDKHFSERSGWVDQAAWLAEALGMEYAYGPNIDNDPDKGSDKRRQYGNLILSKYPIVHRYNHRLPQVVIPGAWNEARGLLEAHVSVNGRTVRFLNTHLGLSQAERTAQIRRLLEVYRSGEGPCLVTGDFNAEPGAEELVPLRETFTDACAAANGVHGGTFLAVSGKESGTPTIRPTVCIDYMFCTREFRVVRAGTVDTAASDHLPVVAELEFI